MCELRGFSASEPISGFRPLPRDTVLELVGGQIVYEAQSGGAG